MNFYLMRYISNKAAFGRWLTENACSPSTAVHLLENAGPSGETLEAGKFSIERFRNFCLQLYGPRSEFLVEDEWYRLRYIECIKFPWHSDLKRPPRLNEGLRPVRKNAPLCEIEPGIVENPSGVYIDDESLLAPLQRFKVWLVHNGPNLEGLNHALYYGAYDEKKSVMGSFRMKPLPDGSFRLTGPVSEFVVRNNWIRKGLYKFANEPERFYAHVHFDPFVSGYREPGRFRNAMCRFEKGSPTLDGYI